MPFNMFAYKYLKNIFQKLLKWFQIFFLFPKKEKKDLDRMIRWIRFEKNKWLNWQKWNFKASCDYWSEIQETKLNFNLKSMLERDDGILLFNKATFL